MVRAVVVVVVGGDGVEVGCASKWREYIDFYDKPQTPIYSVNGSAGGTQLN